MLFMTWLVHLTEWNSIKLWLWSHSGLSKVSPSGSGPWLHPLHHLVASCGRHFNQNLNLRNEKKNLPFNFLCRYSLTRSSSIFSVVDVVVNSVHGLRSAFGIRITEEWTGSELLSVSPSNAAPTGIGTRSGPLAQTYLLTTGELWVS